MEGLVCDDVGAALAAVEEFQRIRAHRRAGSVLFREARASMLLRDFFEPVRRTRMGPRRSMRFVAIGRKAWLDWQGGITAAMLLSIGLRTIELAADRLRPVGARLRIRVREPGREFRFSGVVAQLGPGRAVVLLFPAAGSPLSCRSAPRGTMGLQAGAIGERTMSLPGSS